MVSSSVNLTSATESRIVFERSNEISSSMPAGILRDDRWQLFLDPIYDGDHIGPGLLLHSQH